jgi:hypothetical protein
VLSLELFVEAFCDDGLLEVVDPFWAEDLLEVVLLEFVCARAIAPVSRTVPRIETSIFIEQSP